MKQGSGFAGLVATVALAVAAAAAAATLAATPQACTLLSRQEIAAALGRTDIAAPKAAAAGPGTSDCRFAGGARGDVRIVIAPRQGADGFVLRGRILKEEGQAFEVVAGIGERAYVWADSVQAYVGGRSVSLWLVRRPGSEPEPQVRRALIELAKAGAARLGP